jgi:DNA-binding winged helix-turn-helix (wHTH) protein
MTDKTLSGTGTGISCFILKTGRPDWHACFYPGLYQLNLYKGGIEEKIDLGYSGSRLLERLLLNPGELVYREELLSHAWSGRVVSQGSLNQQVHTLRQILADDKNHEIIQTLPRRGYMFNPEFFIGLSSVNAAGEAERALRTEPATAVAAKRRRHWAVPTLAGISSLILGVFVLSYVYLQDSLAKLVSAEMNGGKVYILYVNKGGKLPQNFAVERSSKRLAAFE